MTLSEKDKKLWDLYHKTACCFRASNSKTWNQADLTMPQIRILFTLVHRGESTVGSLAKAMHVRAPNVTFILDHLQKQKLISRKRSKDDRRLVLINLTSKGNKLIDNLMRAKYEGFHKVLSRISDDDKKALLKGLQALNKACADLKKEA